MEKVLITGITGFVGKLLAERLSEDGYEVHGLERYVTGRYSLDKNNKEMILHYGNLTEYKQMSNIIRTVKPDYLVHLAAISPVAYSYEHYIEVTEVDYLASLNLAEACYREAPNFKQFIFAGTSEEYGVTLKDMDSKLTEESVMQPNSPYSVAKVATDMYLRYMYKAYGFPYTIMRPFNTYGRTDNKHFFIERTITQMLTQDKVHLGDPEAVRDWVYATDHVEGYVKALGNEKAIGESFNICTGKGYTTKDTADTISKLTGFGGEVVWRSTPPRPLDIKILIGDNSKAERLLGWKPSHNLEQGLKKTISFWEGELKGGSK